MKKNTIIIITVICIASLFGLGYLWYVLDEFYLWFERTPHFEDIDMNMTEALETCTETYEPIQSSTRAQWAIRQRGTRCIMDVNFFEEFEKEDWTWYEVMEKYRCKVTPEFIEQVDVNNREFIKDNCWQLKTKR